MMKKPVIEAALERERERERRKIEDEKGKWMRDVQFAWALIS